MERLRGHYRESLITPWLQLWSITPVKIDPRPRVRKLKKVEATLSSGLSLSLSSGLSFSLFLSLWLSLSLSRRPCKWKFISQRSFACFQNPTGSWLSAFQPDAYFLSLLLLGRSGAGRAQSSQRASIQEEPEQQRFQEQTQRGTKNLSINVRKRLETAAFKAALQVTDDQARCRRPNDAASQFLPAAAFSSKYRPSRSCVIGRICITH